MVTRSSVSLDFQRMWSELREEDELVPQYSALHPRQFADFLPATILAEFDPGQGTMIVRLAGSLIRSFIGFELTGKDLTNYVTVAYENNEMPVRLAYHDQPAGRYNEVMINFESGLEVNCCLTALPLWGKNHQRLIATFVEPRDHVKMQTDDTAKIMPRYPDHASYIDIGAGIPDVGRHDA